jgi:hypothetical protein
LFAKGIIHQVSRRFVIVFWAPKKRPGGLLVKAF